MRFCVRYNFQYYNEAIIEGYKSARSTDDFKSPINCAIVERYADR